MIFWAISTISGEIVEVRTSNNSFDYWKKKLEDMGYVPHILKLNESVSKYIYMGTFSGNEKNLLVTLGG